MTASSNVVSSTWFKVTVGTTCSLSILGCLMIILSYCGFKTLRTTARLVLVHLSIMDMGCAASNLIGLTVDFSRYYRSGEPDAAVRHACVAQAAFADYFTVGSFLWTIAMSLYIYVRIVHHKTPNAAQVCLWASTVFCYGMPVLIMLWGLFTERLGYAPKSTEGWCGSNYVDNRTGQRSVLLAFMGYDMWLFLNYIIVPVLYISVLLFIHQQLMKTTMFVTSERFWDAVHKLDFKLLLIPIAFLMLRVWSFVNIVIYVYDSHLHVSDEFLKVNVYLAGIGDSGQGLMNAILFVILTKKVRNKLFPCCRNIKCSPCCQKVGERTPLIGGSLQDGRIMTYENTPHLVPSLSSLNDSIKQ